MKSTSKAFNPIQSIAIAGLGFAVISASAFAAQATNSDTLLTQVRLSFELANDTDTKGDDAETKHHAALTIMTNEDEPKGDDAETKHHAALTIMTNEDEPKGDDAETKHHAALTIMTNEDEPKGDDAETKHSNLKELFLI
jgi:hypothetical protein